MTDNREKVWSWFNIALVFDVHESTVKRWAREEPSFRRIVKRWRRRVFAYREDLELWREQMEGRLPDAPRPGSPPASCTLAL